VTVTYGEMRVVQVRQFVRNSVVYCRESGI